MNSTVDSLTGVSEVGVSASAFNIVWRPEPHTTPDEWLEADFDGDGQYDWSYRKDNQIWVLNNTTNTYELFQVYGNGNSEDEYLVGDWDGDGRDNIAVRRGSQILMDYNYDGYHDQFQIYGYGNSEDGYLVGDSDGDGRDNIGVLRGAYAWVDYNYDSYHDDIISWIVL